MFLAPAIVDLLKAQKVTIILCILQEAKQMPQMMVQEVRH